MQPLEPLILPVANSSNRAVAGVMALGGANSSLYCSYSTTSDLMFEARRIWMMGTITRPGCWTEDIRVSPAAK